MQQQQHSFTQQVKSLNERIDQESATVSGLQRALDDKELQLKQTTQSLNEVSYLNSSFRICYQKHFFFTGTREITESCCDAHLLAIQNITASFISN
jgi:hypothetical protein